MAIRWNKLFTVEMYIFRALFNIFPFVCCSCCTLFWLRLLARSSTFESFFPTCPLRIPDDFFKNATFDSCIFMEFNYWWKFFQYLEKVCHWKLASGRHLNCSKGFFCLESGWNSVKSQSLISCSALNLKLFSTSFSDSKTFRFGSVRFGVYFRFVWLWWSRNYK